MEVGSGTGAILASLRVDGYTRLTGLDVDFKALEFSRLKELVCADAHQLPFFSNSFAVCISHFLMLWARNPLTVLREMRRVTRAGGWLAALAEPNYLEREDLPAGLQSLGQAQSAALAEQGADIGLGARLGQLFTQAGLTEVETGIILPQPRGQFCREEFEMEWAVMRRDLAGRSPKQQIQEWYQLDLQAAARGESRHHVPIHFALGQKH